MEKALVQWEIQHSVLSIAVLQAKRNERVSEHFRCKTKECRYKKGAPPKAAELVMSIKCLIFFTRIKRKKGSCKPYT
jgi:hypothetical protein